MTKYSDRPSASGIAAPVLYLLSGLGWAAGRRFEQALEPFGIGPRHYAVLHTALVVGPDTQRGLGRSLGIDASSMVALVDRLEHHDLVTREPRDRRSNVIQATTRARELHETIQRTMNAVEEEALAALDADQRRALAELLTALARSGTLPIQGRAGTG